MIKSSARCALGAALVAGLLLLTSMPAPAFMDEAAIALRQQQYEALPVAERIVRWANAFVGTPYDPDPEGAYVTRKAIVADDKVDCMYLTMRSIELGLSNTPADAARRALDVRFIMEGRLAPDGSVENYAERFQYAEDALKGGKWGTDITQYLAPTSVIKGARGIRYARMIPKVSIPIAMEKMESGDIVYFVKDYASRVNAEIVGHVGIVERDPKKGLLLIHASGSKNIGGEVKKVSFKGYVDTMHFIGIFSSRFGPLPAEPEPLESGPKPGHSKP